jgi:DNA-binding transcriptional LysR family regulator
MPEDLDLSRVDLNLLVLFEAVMRERHVARTGARLHLSPSAISHGLARLRGLLHDPLFLKHPKGVVPTERAEQLAAPIAEILQRVRSVVSNAVGFDAQHSTRRFTIGAPDAVLTAVLPPLLTKLAKLGPKIDLSTHLVLPPSALADLDARHVDLVIQPIVDVPPRFVAARLYDEDFCIALRAGHPIGKRPSLARYCGASHVLVSATGDPFGNVDIELKKLGRARRIAATVPNFMLALALVAETDLVAAVPRAAAEHARKLGVLLVEPPAPLAPLTRSAINVIATRAAFEDAGVAWLFRVISESTSKRRPR